MAVLEASLRGPSEKVWPPVKRSGPQTTTCKTLKRRPMHASFFSMVMGPYQSASFSFHTETPTQLLALRPFRFLGSHAALTFTAKSSMSLENKHICTGYGSTSISPSCPPPHHLEVVVLHRLASFHSYKTLPR